MASYLSTLWIIPISHWPFASVSFALEYVPWILCHPLLPLFWGPSSVCFAQISRTSADAPRTWRYRRAGSPVRLGRLRGSCKPALCTSVPDPVSGTSVLTLPSETSSFSEPCGNHHIGLCTFFLDHHLSIRSHPVCPTHVMPSLSEDPWEPDTQVSFILLVLCVKHSGKEADGPAITCGVGGGHQAGSTGFLGSREQRFLTQSQGWKLLKGRDR